MNRDSASAMGFNKEVKPFSHINNDGARLHSFLIEPDETRSAHDFVASSI